MKRKTIILNEDLDTSNISDPTLLQMAINIKSQKDNATKAYNNQVQGYDKQLLDILKKQEAIDKTRSKTKETDDQNTQNRPQVNNQNNQSNNQNNNQQQSKNSNENYISIRSFNSYINEDEILINKTHPKLYIEFTDNANICVGKLFKVDDNSEWTAKIISGISPEFSDITFPSDLSEENIIEQLSSKYQDVIKIDYDEYNDKVEAADNIEGDENINEKTFISINNDNTENIFSDYEPSFINELIDSLDINDLYSLMDEYIVEILEKPITTQEKIQILLDNNYSKEDAEDIIQMIDTLKSQKYNLEQTLLK